MSSSIVRIVAAFFASTFLLASCANASAEVTGVMWPNDPVAFEIQVRQEERQGRVRHDPGIPQPQSDQRRQQDKKTADRETVDP